MDSDGWEVSENGKVTPPATTAGLITINTSRLTDPSGVHEQLERLRNIQGDASAVIGASKELVEATIDVIKNKWKDLTQIDCVAAVPSLRRPELVKSFAERVAAKLGVDFIDIIVKPKETEQQKTMENSNMQAQNAYNAFSVIKNVNYNNVLLIDDMIDSGWTLTVCGIMLKEMGAEKVYPYALASTAKNGGDE